jgi:hypothetical protein
MCAFLTHIAGEEPSTGFKLQVQSMRVTPTPPPRKWCGKPGEGPRASSEAPQATLCASRFNDATQLYFHGR